MFNFLNSKLAPKVVCKTPSTDNYEVDNLISNKYSDKIRGFISYPSIKPPVEVEFEFLCPVNIDYVTLNTTVGNQRCSGIELFARTENFSYISIGKRIYDASGIVFCNSRKYSNSELPPNFNCEFQLAFFKSNTFKYFLNAKGIKILIFRTEKSVPCIGCIEVWGSPSKTCSKVTVDTINKLSTNTAPTEFQTSQIVKTEEFKIPEDFQDDLTYEIMTIPMTLPSGKTVNQTTLERHLESEKSFGRKPCDPFTGIKFSDTLKPVINVALKSRIDMFMLQNSHRQEFFNARRIVGGTANNFSESNLKKRIHESDNSDLDNAVANAKRNINFKSFEESEKNKCSTCKIIFDSLYRTPCNHFYCRSCLLTICKDLICKICSKSFVKNNVQKYHF